MTNDIKHLAMYVLAIHISLPILLDCSFSYYILRVLYTSLIRKYFIIYMICRYFSSLWLDFLFSYIFFQRAEATNFDELQFISCVLWIVLLISNLRNICLTPRSQNCILCFLTDILNFKILYLGALPTLSLFVYIMWCLDWNLFFFAIFYCSSSICERTIHFSTYILKICYWVHKCLGSLCLFAELTP